MKRVIERIKFGWKKLRWKAFVSKYMFVVRSLRVTNLSNSIEWCPRISSTMDIAPQLKRSLTAQARCLRRITTPSKIDKVSLAVRPVPLAKSAAKLEFCFFFSDFLRISSRSSLHHTRSCDVRELKWTALISGFIRSFLPPTPPQFSRRDLMVRRDLKAGTSRTDG